MTCICHTELTFGRGPSICYLGHIKNVLDDDDGNQRVSDCG